MRLNQLDGLLAFWKSQSTAGFTAAAAALDVSPSALSQAVRHLEARLGVRLLNRTTRSLSLTEPARHTCRASGRRCAMCWKPKSNCMRFQGRPSGVLRIKRGTNLDRHGPAAAVGWIPEGIPGRQVELTNDEGYVDIVERGFDAGVRMGKVPEEHGRCASGRPDCRCHRRIA